MSQKLEQDDFREDMFKERRRNPLVLVGMPTGISLVRRTYNDT